MLRLCLSVEGLMTVHSVWRATGFAKCGKISLGGLAACWRCGAAAPGGKALTNPSPPRDAYRAFTGNSFTSVASAVLVSAR